MSISPSIKVFLVNSETIKTHPKSQFFKQQKFEGSYRQALYLAESSELFVGTTYKSVSQTTDPFARVWAYDLGAKVFEAISKVEFENLEIQANELFQKSDEAGVNNSLLQFMLGILQASWNFDKYLAPKKAKTKKINIALVDELKPYFTADFEKLLNTLNDAQVLTRSLINDTPEAINPKTYLEIINQELESKPNVTVESFDATKLEELGMNGILFVGRASRYQPVFVHATLKPEGEITKKICLVGKGLTYDSGGLDIKTDGHMPTMKCDMGGSATMFGVFKALSELNLEHTEVHFLTALAENMVSENSYKADDIITSYSGQTIEVRNTDAEGRLTLADLLAYATLLNPDYIIDAATLTGACVVAVSDYYTSLMSNSKELSTSLLQTFEKQGEMTVYNQMPEVLREAVTSQIADLNNTSSIGRLAGHLTAGLFLSHFVDQNLFRNEKLQITEPKVSNWVHLDIAGSSFNDKHNPLNANGATGQSVRSLVTWVLEQDKQ